MCEAICMYCLVIIFEKWENGFILQTMHCIHLNEDETTSSSRIFIKILFQELSEYMGLPKLNERLKDK